MSKARRKTRRKRRGADRAPLRIGVLTCVWQRHALTDLVLGHYAALRAAVAGDLTLVPLAVGSEGEVSRALCERHGFRYVEHANQPLGAKWNAGLRALRGERLDAVLIVGSDDLLDVGCITHYGKLLRGGARFIGLRDMYFFDQPTGRLLYWPGYVGVREGETTGLGRVIHKAYLDGTAWRLWDDHLASGLDRSMMAHLAPVMHGHAARHHVIGARDAGFVPVDVKTAVNLWSFDQVAGSGRFEYLDPDAVLGACYDEALIEAIDALPTDRAPAAPKPAPPDPAPAPSRPAAATPHDGPGDARAEASGGRATRDEKARPMTAAARLAVADRTDTLLEMGERAFAAGSVDDARAAFETVLAIDPTHVRALNDMAVVHHLAGEMGDAELMLLRAAVFDGGSADALVNLASIARGQGRLSEAAAFVQRAAEVAGDAPQVLAETAELAEQSGDRDGARALWNRIRREAPAPGGYRAAFIELDITPALGDRPVAMQGLWSAKPRIATGVEGRLRAQILMLEDAWRTRSLLVGADIFAFDPQMVERIRAWAALWGIEPDAILLNASHTHYGPGTFDGAVPGLGLIDGEYATAVCDAIGGALPHLYQALAPATVSWTRADVQIGFNRRQPRGDRIVMAPHPAGHYETETPLLLVTRKDGAGIVLVNHGCHPTGLGAASTISPDYVGPMRDRVRAELGAMTMFLQGAAGDIKHGADTGSGPRWSTDVTATHAAGHRLAEGVIAALKAGTRAVSGPIRATRQAFSAPLKPRGPVAEVVRDPQNAHVAPGMLREWAAIVGPRDGDRPPRTLESAVTVLGIGEVAFCAFSGEPVAEMARRIRARSTRHEATFVLGYTNGLQAYLPTAEMVREGGYEAHRSHFVYALSSGFDEGVQAAVLDAADAGRAAAGHALGPHPALVPPPTEHAGVFVMSTGRSGTQTLAHVLQTATNAKVWHHPEPKLVQETLLAYWGAIDRRALFWQARGEIIRQAWDAGRVHGETDHNMTAFADVIATEIPGSRFVVLVRDPREFVRSGMRRSYYVAGNIWDQGRLRPPDGDPARPAFDALDPFEKVCWLWAETYRRILAITEALPADRYRVVRFEDLVAGPEETAAIFEFLGLDGFDEATIAGVLGQKLNAQKVGDFPHPAAWSAELHDRCWAHVGEVAERYGYPQHYAAGRTR